MILICLTVICQARDLHHQKNVQKRATPSTCRVCIWAVMVEEYGFDMSTKRISDDKREETCADLHGSWHECEDDACNGVGIREGLGFECNGCSATQASVLLMSAALLVYTLFMA